MLTDNKLLMLVGNVAFEVTLNNNKKTVSQIQINKINTQAENKQAFDIIKAVSDTVFDMINTAYQDKPLI